MKKMQTLAERIASSRKAAGLSGEALGKLSGLGQAAISKLETGVTLYPSSEFLFPLADALRVSARWLVTGIDANNSHDAPFPLTLPDDMQRLVVYLTTIEDKKVAAVFELLGVKRN